jgi:hypothetical protein
MMLWVLNFHLAISNPRLKNSRAWRRKSVEGTTSLGFAKLANVNFIKVLKEVVLEEGNCPL